MKYHVRGTFHLALGVWLQLALHVGGAAERYGDYSEARMPQYESGRGDHGLVRRPDEYNDRSPDAPAHFDYKYEEESHDKSEDELVKGVDDEKMWYKPVKKKIKPHSDASFDLDKDRDDETELISNRKIPKPKPKLRNRRVGERSKINAIKRSDDSDNVENKSDYIHRDNTEMDDNADDLEDINYLGHILTTLKKVRRKPRDRSLQSEKFKVKHSRLEAGETEGMSDRDYFERNGARRLGGIIDREGISLINKQKYDYDEYEDMKRVHNIKNQMPTLLRRTTERPKDAASTIRHDPERRADRSENSPDMTKSTLTSTTPASTTTNATVATKSVNLTADSLAEKSRLSILRKAQRKESSVRVSLSTKPPVLLQVTRGLQTVVMVEPTAGAGAALRAREVAKESPERLQRARRLMRRKLVAGARSIADLTDDWDQMVCDYIDVALLDADDASSLRCSPIYIFILGAILKGNCWLFL